MGEGQGMGKVRAKVDVKRTFSQSPHPILHSILVLRVKHPA
jgi:hypothetical protein